MIKGKHSRGCKRDAPQCPCLTCIHDNYNGGHDVETEMCCYDLHPHEGGCRWTYCKDYESEKER